MHKIKVPLFDWSGNLREELKEDEEKFDITITEIPGTTCMGHTEFELSGEQSNLDSFVEHYELEEILDH